LLLPTTLLYIQSALAMTELWNDHLHIQQTSAAFFAKFPLLVDGHLLCSKIKRLPRLPLHVAMIHDIGVHDLRRLLKCTPSCSVLFYLSYYYFPKQLRVCFVSCSTYHWRYPSEISLRKNTERVRGFLYATGRGLVGSHRTFHRHYRPYSATLINVHYHLFELALENGMCIASEVKRIGNRLFCHTHSLGFVCTCIRFSGIIR